MSLTICDVCGVIGTHSASHPALPTIVSAVAARPNAVFWAVEKTRCIPAVYRYTALSLRPEPLAEVYSSTAVYSGIQYTALQRSTVYSGIHSPSAENPQIGPMRRMPSFSTPWTVWDDPRLCGHLHDVIYTLSYQETCDCASPNQQPAYISRNLVKSRSISDDLPQSPGQPVRPRPPDPYIVCEISPRSFRRV